MPARRRRAGAAAALVLALGGGVLAITQPADAASPITTGAAAYSAAANNGSAVLSPNLQISTSLGGIVNSQIDPIKKNDLDPLVAALRATNNTTVLSSLGAGSTLNAKTNGTQSQSSTAPAAFPNDTVPSPCAASDTTHPCYSKSSDTTIDDSPLVTAQVGAVGGYVEQVSSTADVTDPIFGRATAANASVSVLPDLTSLANPVVSATAIDSKATCPNDGAIGSTQPNTSPSASTNVDSVSMLGGLVTFAVADGNITNVAVNGTTYPDVLTMPTTTVNGMTVSSYGYSLSVSIPLTVTQVIENVGLPASVGTDLEQFSATSTVALQLIVGPKAALTANTAVARGLGIGVDLSGTLEFNLYNLATADVNIPSGLSNANDGNLLDMRLAYANCQSGVTPAAGTPAIPPALV
jgi:hypothetical protein